MTCSIYHGCVFLEGESVAASQAAADITSKTWPLKHEALWQRLLASAALSEEQYDRGGAQVWPTWGFCLLERWSHLIGTTERRHSQTPRGPFSHRLSADNGRMDRVEGRNTCFQRDTLQENCCFVIDNWSNVPVLLLLIHNAINLCILCLSSYFPASSSADSSSRSVNLHLFFRGQVPKRKTKCLWRFSFIQVKIITVFWIWWWETKRLQVQLRSSCLRFRPQQRKDKWMKIKQIIC